MQIPYIPPEKVKKLGTIFGGLFAFGIMFGFIGFPSLLKFAIKKNTQLKPGSEIRKMFEKVPFAIDFKIYVFNYTNPDEIQRGGTPHVQEIGPYMFEEWKEKFDIIDNEEEDTMEYDMKNIFIFRPDLSGPLTGNEVITLPHLLVMGAMIATKRDNEPMLPMVISGINVVTENPTTPFLTGKFIDIFFNGIPLLCDPNETDMGALGLCSAMENDGGLKRMDPTHLGFALFAPNNDSTMGRFKALRGVKNIHDTGRVVEFNGEPEIDTYDEDACNVIRGTDSTIFPPFLTKEEGFWAFAPDLCRSLGTEYVGKSSYMGVKTTEFTIKFPDLRKDPEHQCWCRDPPDGCPPEGLMELYQCVKFPFLASKPHLLDVDKRVQDKIHGIRPNRDEHEIFIHADLYAGAPLSAAKRLQFNLDMEPVEDFEIMKNLPKMITPLFWVEESASLNKTYMDMFKKLVNVKKFNKGLRWTCVTIGLIGGILCIYIMVQAEERIRKVTPIKEAKTPDPVIQLVCGGFLLGVAVLTGRTMKLKINANSQPILGLGVALGLILAGFIAGHVVRPMVLNQMIKKIISFAPGSPIRDLYLTFNFPVYMNLTLFNITNSEEILQGAKPAVEEVGPYVFEQWFHKINVEDDEAEDTITFDTRPIWRFNKEKTLPLTGAEKIVMYDLILVAGLIRTQRETPELMDLIRDGIDRILGFPTHPFIHLTAFEFLWDGAVLNCDQQEFSAKAVCAALGGEGMEKFNATHYKASLFKRENNTVLGRFKVYRGKKDILRINEMVEFNGSPQMEMYDEDYCNEVRGFEPLYFPPFLQKAKPKTVFLASFCRSFDYFYERKSSVRKIPGLRFTRPPFNDNIGSNQCFCRDGPETCPPKGFFDMSICQHGGPIVVSSPHFYGADPKVQDMVDGLKPEKAKHESFMDFHKVLGAPMNSSHKFQLNIDMQPVDAHPALKDLPTMYMPFVWMAIGTPLENELWQYIVKAARGIKIFKIIKYLLIFGGLVVGAVMGAMQLGILGGTKPISPGDVVVDETHDNNGTAFQYTSSFNQEEKPKDEYM